MSAVGLRETNTALKFPVPGTKHGGQISEMRDIQVREFGTGTLQFWDEEHEEPKMQTVLTLITGQDDSGGPEEKDLYVKPGRMTKAVQAALRAARVTEPEIGGFLGIEYTGDVAAKSGTGTAKDYRAEYTPPVARVAPEDDYGDPPF